jgi:excisionase family DNA binding protein
MAEGGDRDQCAVAKAPGRRASNLLTVEELAAWLRLTPKGIYGLVEGRRIPFIKVSNRVRFLYDDVLAWLRENRVPASEN